MDRPATVREDLASRHRYAELQRQSFDGEDLTSVHLQQLWFTRCSFRGTDLRHVTLDGCRFNLCDLREVNLRSASLRGVSLAGCDLSGADLRDADLTGARFGRVHGGIPPRGLTAVTGIKLDKAILRDLELDQVIGWPITTRSFNAGAH